MSKRRIYASRIFKAPPIVINFYNKIIDEKINEYRRDELMKDVCNVVRENNSNILENNYITFAKNKEDIICVVMFPLKMDYNKYGQLCTYVDKKGRMYVEIEE